jgi:hypothetical protein
MWLLWNSKSTKKNPMQYSFHWKTEWLTVPGYRISKHTDSQHVLSTTILKFHTASISVVFRIRTNWLSLQHVNFSMISPGPRNRNMTLISLKTEWTCMKIKLQTAWDDERWACYCMHSHPPIGKVGDECRGACGISVFDGSQNGRRKLSVLTVAENIKIFPS